MKKIKITIFVSCISFMFMCSACNEKTNEEISENVSGKVTSSEQFTTSEQVSPENETDIDELADDAMRLDISGFYYVTVQKDEETGESEIFVWKTKDEQTELIQQIACDINLEEAELYCEDFNDTYPDLQIIYRGEGDEDGKGYLYLWDRQNHVFSEDYIEIPTEYEVIVKMGIKAVVVTEQDDETERKRICKVDEEGGRLVTMREWNLDKESGHLTIYDCYSKQTLYDGVMGNEKYYEYLFWQDIPYVLAASSSSISIKTGEHRGEEYPDKISFLEACGFAGEEAFYTYYDSMGNIQIELYFDEENGRGCGIDYFWKYIDEDIENVSMTGFTFDEVTEEAWEEPDPYSLLSVYGEDGTWAVTDYTESITYTEDGKIDRFYSEGTLTWELSEDGLEHMRVLDIDFVYRDDGTLAYRDYTHNSFIFGTWWQSVKSLYDESERLIYEKGYVTHGYVDRYYIYADDEKAPMYCFEMDIGPNMIRYFADNP